MREILFRGKTRHDEWICGDYEHFESYGRIHPIISMWGVHITDVLPETVGQYTGLTDKNGKKIFEGDIVQAKRICNSDNWIGCVVFWNGCFAIQGLKDRNVPAIDLFNEYEVIGNIHDNPELLKGVKSDA